LLQGAGGNGFTMIGGAGYYQGDKTLLYRFVGCDFAEIAKRV
jgi:hypothetical protein